LWAFEGESVPEFVIEQLSNKCAFLRIFLNDFFLIRLGELLYTSLLWRFEIESAVGQG
jgi:hypothetical protein